MNVYNLTDVQHAYGSRTVLNIRTLTVAQGEIFAIVGPSGAGKSTLLRLLALLEPPSQGSVELRLGDQSIRYETASIHERRQVTIVFQRPVLLSRSVRANVAYPLQLRSHRNGRERVDAALQLVSMLHLSNARPSTLSGGEVQRVALARALVIEPRVLLLDEPTTNLDPYNVGLIEALIREQCERHNTTIVLVTHNVFQARRLASRVGLLLKGELVEVLPTEMFFNAPRDARTAAFTSGELVY